MKRIPIITLLISALTFSSFGFAENTNENNATQPLFEQLKQEIEQLKQAQEQRNTQIKSLEDNLRAVDKSIADKKQRIQKLKEQLQPVVE